MSAPNVFACNSRMSPYPLAGDSRQDLSVTSSRFARKTHAIQHAIAHPTFSDAKEITMVTNNAISASEIKRIKHVVCGIKRIDHILSGSCRDGLTGDTSLATLLLVLTGCKWWCKQ